MPSELPIMSLSTEICPSSPQPNTSVNFDSPGKASLKRKIRELEIKDRIKNRKIRVLQKRVWYQKKRLFHLKKVVKELMVKHLINEDQVAVILQNFGKNNEMINRMFRKSKDIKLSKKYGEELKKFALTLHFFSPKAYEYVRKSFQNCLPHTKALAKWYSAIDAGRGFTTEVLQLLSIKAVTEKKNYMFSSN